MKKKNDLVINDDKKIKFGDIFVPSGDASGYDFKIDSDKFWRFLGQKPKKIETKKVLSTNNTNSSSTSTSIIYCKRCLKKEKLLSNEYCIRCDKILFGEEKK